MKPNVLSEALVELLAEGVALRIGTRDAQCVPESALGWGAHANRAEGTITLYVPKVHAGATIANLDANGQIAVTFSRVTDYRTFQVKGVARSWRDARDDERPLLERYRDEFAAQLVSDAHEAHALTTTFWPALAIEIEVRDVFLQTPGPGTGERLGR